MPPKNKPRRAPPRVAAPSGIFIQLSRDEWRRGHDVAYVYAPECTFTLSPFYRTVCVHWSSPEHLLCDAAALYPNYIDILLEPGVVDEAINLVDAGALAEFYYACDRLNEFDSLVLENARARDHILSLDQPPYQPPPAGRHGDSELITPAQNRVRAVVAAAAARRAVEEISHGC